MRYEVFSYDTRDGISDQRIDGAYKRRRYAESCAQQLVISGERTSAQVMRDDGRIIAFYDEEEVVMEQAGESTARVRILPSEPDEVHVEVTFPMPDNPTDEEMIRAATAAVRQEIERVRRTKNGHAGE